MTAESIVITPDHPEAGPSPEGNVFAAWLAEHGIRAEQVYCVEVWADRMTVYAYRTGPNGESRVLYGGKLAVDYPRTVPLKSPCPIRMGDAQLNHLAPTN